jgi:hypothetical protein
MVPIDHLTLRGARRPTPALVEASGRAPPSIRASQQISARLPAPADEAVRWSSIQNDHRRSSPSSASCAGGGRPVHASNFIETTVRCPDRAWPRYALLRLGGERRRAERVPSVHRWAWTAGRGRRQPRGDRYG